MSSQRHLARIAAMQTLYSYLERDSRLDLDAAFKFVLAELPQTLKQEDFARSIFDGAISQKTKLLAEIEKFSTEHSLKKLDNLSLAILLIGAWELLFASEKTPLEIVINEAIELAKEFGKETSAPLINAILSKIANQDKDNEKNNL
ncbi:MAG TPA: transcription antitermination factor NusB [Candidatus Gracilibacteria bacterium]|nr:transcription antitermination factor NusB [Candidatus Gracilibacteria bacterium]